MNNIAETNNILYIHIGHDGIRGGFFTFDRTNVTNVAEVAQAEVEARRLSSVDFNDIDPIAGDTRVQLDSDFVRIGELVAINSLILPECKYIVAGNINEVEAKISQLDTARFNEIRGANPNVNTAES
ncbi:hypothetical protein FBU31_001281 [Coemansia sp. 'formosensis']|nr:hypothetical protein FBU31_001281 [Coemansia sp. 'formosensis']